MEIHKYILRLSCALNQLLHYRNNIFFVFLLFIDEEYRKEKPHYQQDFHDYFTLIPLFV